MWYQRWYADLIDNKGNGLKCTRIWYIVKQIALLLIIFASFVIFFHAVLEHVFAMKNAILLLSK